jgi:pyridinium-3,5-biscarboxylic acid mononucleotide synthase
MRLRALLVQVESGEVRVDEALTLLERLPFADIGHAVVDHHRALRMGIPEVVLGLGKTVPQIAGVVQELMRTGQNVLVTRVEPEKAREIQALGLDLTYHEVGRTLSFEHVPIKMRAGVPVAIVTAGTSDIPVAEEAAETLRMCGIAAHRIFDVGVAGLHRLLARVAELQAAPAVIVVAGMEGALPSVVGGLLGSPVIAVPTSVGYGASLGGLTALMGMLSGCASGVTVVNIDNGFGAAMAVLRLLRARPSDGTGG